MMRSAGTKPKKRLSLLFVELSPSTKYFPRRDHHIDHLFLAGIQRRHFIADQARLIGQTGQLFIDVQFSIGNPQMLSPGSPATRLQQ